MTHHPSDHDAVRRTFLIAFLVLLALALFLRLARGPNVAWFAAIGLAAASLVMGIATIDRELVATGGIWFHLLAYALQVGLFTALAVGIRVSAVTLPRSSPHPRQGGMEVVSGSCEARVVAAPVARVHRAYARRT
jgi:hypothetical protein